MHRGAYRRFGHLLQLQDKGIPHFRTTTRLLSHHLSFTSRFRHIYNCLMFRLMLASWPTSFLVLCLSKHIYTCTIYCFQEEIVFTHRISSDLRASSLRLVQS